MFDPKAEYQVNPDIIPIEDFYRYKEEYIVRAPYQRKSVWSRRKQQALLDSLFRRYYIPRIVVRQVRLDGDRIIREVIDGQQRITTVQLFFANKLPLPRSLADVHPVLAGAYYEQLPSDIRRFIDRMKYSADVVTGIEDPHDPEHQRIASEIFWRLQQGESLNYMEIAHARLSSLVRNFIVKYGDDYTFDYDAYKPIDVNPHKHSFFKIYDRDNDRMQHLSLLARLLLIERDGGPTETKDTQVAILVDETQQSDGIGNDSFEKTPEARAVLRTLDALYAIFKDDSMADDENGLKEFKIEYFVISVYLLLRHIMKHYVFDASEKALFRDFVYQFHQRWRARSEQDSDILIFADSRQQSKSETELRLRIMRQIFFEFAHDQGHAMLSKDDRRAFSEAERITIYRRDVGLCQQCLEEGKPENEAIVSWEEYEADHVLPYSRGGQTIVENGQVLCRYHNRAKGATVN